ncbi:putative integral membrane protein conserved region-domain-containing protein [Catenaria anguillulae PL171]|uniref:Putative integral membrane protein conserved region-domain-containing protein n=1 Tax=Catenaria anguillulae PL171 TaxID=765915 RepID=A0A1Y2I4T0_9FUNG|nr:putative integral membrane protein conserved region-domain-containing protein [Catenaria anguillulae PL171]
MNAVEKEAWYLALRRASATGTHESTQPPHFHSAYSALRSTLLSPPSTLPLDHSTLWLNALIGRAFLTVQDHPLLTRYLLSKFTKKLDRLPALPGFLSSLRVASVDPGRAAPLLTNAALVKCDASGHVEVEVDVAYTGNARVQLAADVVLSLGSTVASIAGKLGAGDGVASDLRVPVVLGVTLAEVRGRLRVAMRPPPSNRAWVGFVDAPRLIVRAEPVVNTKQLRLAMVLDLIESKVRDLLVASMVLPNMEDVCIARAGGAARRVGRFKAVGFIQRLQSRVAATQGQSRFGPWPRRSRGVRQRGPEAGSGRGASHPCGAQCRSRLVQPCL